MPNLNEIYYALLGTGFTFFATALGASLVFFFKKDIKAGTQKVFLGFAAGVMIAASVWSLLIPAIEMTVGSDLVRLMPVVIGFILGAAFLLLLDRVIPHIHIVSNETEGVQSNFRRTTMLFLAVTLHNIPEGMAVGITFSLASKSSENAALAGAVALAIGMGLQNLPEGAAISLPLRKEGFSRKKSFIYGALSGVVEPIAGVLTVFAASSVIGIMPWVLSFAAGAMIYVVVEELIPEAQLGEHSHRGTISVLAGFLVMMVLDTALG